MPFFLRYASKLDTLPNRTPVRAYDARFLFVLSGKGELRLSDRTIPLSENSLCYYPAGTEYFPCFTEDIPFSFITVNFDFSTEYCDCTASYHPVPISEPLEESKLKPSHLSFVHAPFQEAFVLDSASHLRESFIRLEREQNSALPFHSERASAILAYIIYDICGQAQKEENLLVRTLSEYLNENYRTVKSNSEVAHALSYHESYLNKIMKEALGTTLHQFILRKKLEEAERMLLYSELSIEEIADEVGFVNTKHFSTLFRHKYGTSPSRYRKKGKWI